MIKCGRKRRPDRFISDLIQQVTGDCSVAGLGMISGDDAQGSQPTLGIGQGGSGGFGLGEQVLSLLKAARAGEIAGDGAQGDGPADGVFNRAGVFQRPVEVVAGGGDVGILQSERDMGEGLDTLTGRRNGVGQVHRAIPLGLGVGDCLALMLLAGDSGPDFNLVAIEGVQDHVRLVAIGVQQFSGAQECLIRGAQIAGFGLIASQTGQELQVAGIG